MKLDSKDFNERGRDFIEVYPQYHVSNFPDNQPVTRMSRKEPAQAAMLGTFIQLSPSGVPSFVESWHLRQFVTSCG